MMDHVSEDEALLGLPRAQSALASLVLGWGAGLVLLAGQLPLLRLYSYQLLHSNPAITAAFHILFYLHTLLGELQPVLIICRTTRGCVRSVRDYRQFPGCVVPAGHLLAPRPAPHQPPQLHGDGSSAPRSFQDRYNNR